MPAPKDTDAPLSEILRVCVRATITLTGFVYGARCGTNEQCCRGEGEALPFDPTGQIIYVGPPAPPGRSSGRRAPTLDEWILHSFSVGGLKT